jgi:hypothetical protein
VLESALKGKETKPSKAIKNLKKCLFFGFFYLNFPMCLLGFASCYHPCNFIHNGWYIAEIGWGFQRGWLPCRRSRRGFVQFGIKGNGKEDNHPSKCAKRICPLQWRGIASQSALRASEALAPTKTRLEFGKPPRPQKARF